MGEGVKRKIVASRFYRQRGTEYPDLHNGIIEPGDVYIGMTSSFPSTPVRFTFDDAQQRINHLVILDQVVSNGLRIAASFGFVLLVGEPFWLVVAVAGAFTAHQTIRAARLQRQFRAKQPTVDVHWTHLKKGDITYELHDGKWTLVTVPALTPFGITDTPTPSTTTYPQSRRRRKARRFPKEGPRR
jgi:hypothetical protein